MDTAGTCHQAWIKNSILSIPTNNWYWKSVTIHRARIRVVRKRKELSEPIEGWSHGGGASNRDASHKEVQLLMTEAVPKQREWGRSRRSLLPSPLSLPYLLPPTLIFGISMGKASRLQLQVFVPLSLLAPKSFISTVPEIEED